MASLLACGVYDEAQYWPTASFPGAGQLWPGGDTGRSASFTVTIAGKGDDPYGPVGMAASYGIALSADTSRELAVQNLAVFNGASAGRAV